MASVRPFRDADIPAVAELHRRVFHVGDPSAPLRAAYRDWLSDVFLERGRPRGPVVSLVHEDEEGAVNGFLGVVPRSLSMAGRPVLAAVSSQLVVDPSSRPRLAGVALLRAFLAGPQDLSIADEANASSAGLWSALGGTTAPLFSIHWTRPLLPFRLALALLRPRAPIRGLAAIAKPLAWAGDALAERVVPRAFRRSHPLHDEPASIEALSEHMPRFGRPGALRPVYDARFLRWALDRTKRTAREDVHSVLLRDQRRQPVGAYVYRGRPGGIGDLLQIGTAQNATRDVLEHLFDHARQRGTLALSGRLEPSLMQALSEGYALLHRRGPYMLVHAKRAELLAAFDRGDAAFARLHGEYCLRFVPPEPS